MRINSYEEMIEVFGDPVDESDQKPAIIHWGDPRTLVALCGHKCIQEVDSRIKANCAKCLAEQAM